MDKVYTVITVNLNVLKSKLYGRGLTIAGASRQLNRNPRSIYTMLHQPNKYWNWDIAHGLSELAGSQDWYEVKKLVEAQK